jgi:hypothetical protein
VILPSKHLPPERALLTVGARLLDLLPLPRTVSSLWEELNRSIEVTPDRSRKRISYDWFVLSLDLLYLMGAIAFEDGLVTRKSA